jgi:hypothetical protein
MAPYIEDGDWRPIAEQVSKEMDSAKLMIIVAKLCRALDGKHKGKSQLQKSPRNEPGAFPAD